MPSLARINIRKAFCPLSADTAQTILIIAGIAAFILMTVYDVNNISCALRIFKGLFFTGIFILSGSMLGLVIYAFNEYLFFDWLAAIGVLFFIIGLFLQIFALFFAIPFKKTYVTSDANRMVVNTGLYALCRHPGVWGFIILCFGLYMATRTVYILSACIIWIVCDLLHVAIQDKFIFPKQLNGYEKYRCATPFLVPNTRSIRAFLASAGGNRSRDTRQ